MKRSEEYAWRIGCYGDNRRTSPQSGYSHLHSHPDFCLKLNCALHEDRRWVKLYSIYGRKIDKITSPNLKLYWNPYHSRIVNQLFMDFMERRGYGVILPLYSSEWTKKYEKASWVQVSGTHFLYFCGRNINNVLMAKITSLSVLLEEFFSELADQLEQLTE